MIDLIMKLSLMQWIFIGAGLLMMIPSIRNVLLGVVNRIRVGPEIKTSVDSNNLTSIVAKWEALNNACIDAGLIDAQERLHEVFLVLATNVADPKHVPASTVGGTG